MSNIDGWGGGDGFFTGRSKKWCGNVAHFVSTMGDDSAVVSSERSGSDSRSDDENDTSRSLRYSGYDGDLSLLREKCLTDDALESGGVHTDLCLLRDLSARVSWESEMDIDIIDDDIFGHETFVPKGQTRVGPRTSQ